MLRWKSWSARLLFTAVLLCALSSSWVAYQRVALRLRGKTKAQDKSLLATRAQVRSSTSVVTEHPLPKSSSTPPPAIPPVLPVKPVQPGLTNSVIVLLLNKNAETRRLVEASLTLLHAHFLECYPYDLHIFHEHDMAVADKQSLRQLVPKSKITFEQIDLPRLALPNGLTFDEVKGWNKWGMGYRQMCRFFSGKLFMLESLQKYDYYWRMDTDSWYTEPLSFDPFVHIQQQGCAYAYNWVRSDDWFVTKGLWDTFRNYTRSAAVPASNISRVTGHVTKNGKYMDTMFETNFEIARLDHFRSKEYQDFIEYLDTQPPFGFLRHRWGDAPVRKLAVHLVLPDHQICDLFRLIPYKHGKYSVARPKGKCLRKS